MKIKNTSKKYDKHSKKSNKKTPKILYSQSYIAYTKYLLKSFIELRKQITAYKKNVKKDFPQFYNMLCYRIKRVVFATKHTRKVLKLMQNNVEVSEQDLFINDMVASFAKTVKENIDFYLSIVFRNISDMEYKNVFGVTPVEQKELNRAFPECGHHTFNFQNIPEGVNIYDCKVDFIDGIENNNICDMRDFSITKDDNEKE